MRARLHRAFETAAVATVWTIQVVGLAVAITVGVFVIVAFVGVGR